MPRHPAPGSCRGRCTLWPRLSHWHVTPLCAHMADVCVASHYPMRWRMSRPILQLRSRSCRARHDAKDAWNPSLVLFGQPAHAGRENPRWRPCAVPPIIQTNRDVCTYGFLPALRRSVGHARRRSPCAFATMAHALAASHARCAVPSLNTPEDTRCPCVDFPRSFWLVSRRCL